MLFSRYNEPVDITAPPDAPTGKAERRRAELAATRGLQAPVAAHLALQALEPRLGLAVHVRHRGGTEGCTSAIASSISSATAR